MFAYFLVIGLRTFHHSTVGKSLFYSVIMLFVNYYSNNYKLCIITWNAKPNQTLVSTCSDLILLSTEMCNYSKIL